MKEKIVIIWDGNEYRQVSEEDADRLVEEDKAQICNQQQADMRDRKFRRDFTGYKTREIRAETVEKPAPKAAPKKKAAKKKKTAAKKTTK